MTDYHPSKEEVSSFCNGMYDAFTYAQATAPDGILIPLRGAYPFFMSCRHLATLENTLLPPAVLLPIGTYKDAHTGRESGLTKPEKIEVINAALAQFIRENPGMKRFLLMDEVMIGGTIMTHHKIISRYLQHVPTGQLNVCAIEDGRYQKTGR
jgi:hypothetical protein